MNSLSSGILPGSPIRVCVCVRGFRCGEGLKRGGWEGEQQNWGQPTKPRRLAASDRLHHRARGRAGGRVGAVGHHVVLQVLREHLVRAARVRRRDDRAAALRQRHRLTVDLHLQRCLRRQREFDLRPLGHWRRRPHAALPHGHVPRPVVAAHLKLAVVERRLVEAFLFRVAPHLHACAERVDVRQNHVLQALHNLRVNLLPVHLHGDVLAEVRRPAQAADAEARVPQLVQSTRLAQLGVVASEGVEVVCNLRVEADAEVVAHHVLPVLHLAPVLVEHLDEPPVQQRAVCLLDVVQDVRDARKRAAAAAVLPHKPASEPEGAAEVVAGAHRDDGDVRAQLNRFLVEVRVQQLHAPRDGAVAARDNHVADALKTLHFVEKRTQHGVGPSALPVSLVLEAPVLLRLVVIGVHTPPHVVDEVQHACVPQLLAQLLLDEGGSGTLAAGGVCEGDGGSTEGVGEGGGGCFELLGLVVLEG
eukprot:Rhum_TRINITY_DN3159_c0_g1::Rhum_TRINITY_DN3159_c0_g1_i1::g.9843::m.9843